MADGPVHAKMSKLFRGNVGLFRSRTGKPGRLGGPPEGGAVPEPVAPFNAAMIVPQASPVSGLAQDRTMLFLRNVGAASIASIAKILIQFALLPIMALLLGPKEFGIYALAIPVVVFLTVIADGGIGLSLARDRTDAPEIWSTAFWLLIASGLAISAIVVACGLLLAKASSEPQLVTIMLILAASFPFLSLSVLPIARLNRQGNLVACALADLVATVVGAACAIGLGLLHFGAKSLAVQYLAGSIVRAIILSLHAFERPKAVFRPFAMLDHLSSGGILMGSRVADLACRSSESLLFGNAFGPTSLGAYNLATQIPRFLFEAFGNPCWAALFAHGLSEQRGRLLQIYYKVSRFIAFITFPTAAVLAAAGPELMAHSLGPTWRQAGTFVQILAPGYALGATASIGTALLLAFNANVVFFLITVLLAVGRVIAVGSGFYLNAWQSVMLVTVFHVIYSVVVWLSVKDIVGAELSELLRGMAVSFCASVLAGAACWGILLVGETSIGTLCGAIVVAAALFIAVMMLIDGNSIKNDLLFLKGFPAAMFR